MPSPLPRRSDCRCGSSSSAPRRAALRRRPERILGALRRDAAVRSYAAPLAGIGIVISTYHYLIEWNPQWEGTSCDIVAPCSTPYFREFDFVSLAFMALCGFATILALLLLVPAPRRRRDADVTPQ